MKISININETVKVKLNDHGRKILRSNHDQFVKDCPSYTHKYQEPKTDDDGYSRFQIHELMNAFGNHMVNGCKMPFHCEIVIEREIS